MINRARVAEKFAWMTILTTAKRVTSVLPGEVVAHGLGQDASTLRNIPFRACSRLYLAGRMRRLRQLLNASSSAVQAQAAGLISGAAAVVFARPRKTRCGKRRLASIWSLPERDIQSADAPINDVYCNVLVVVTR